MQVENFNKWNARIGFMLPEEKQRGAEYQYIAYVEGKDPKELRKAILNRIKFLEENNRVVKNIEVIHDIRSCMTSSKEEYLSGKVKRDK